jgi:energy-coupling factor transport system ATP-binding protein
MGLIPHLYNGELSGEVWLNGDNTMDMPLWKLAEKVGMVFQNPAAQMLAPSVEDEIIFGLENLGLSHVEIQNRLESVLDEFNLVHMRERNPHTLSGGEQQKLALASILARQPDAIILDEPLSMLDTTAAGELVAYLERYAAGNKALVVFEHRQEYLAGVNRVRQINLSGKPGEETPPKSTLPQPHQGKFRLEIEALSVRLGERDVLDNMNLSFEGGQIVAVVGGNGVGKTTLLRSISGLQKYKGSVRVVAPNGPQRPDLAMVFQNPDLQLFNASVRDEILYRLENPDMDYYQWLIAALGLETYENTPPLLLSEGQKKRLALGLALMRRPEHGLLLDEPSLGQDQAHKNILVEILRALADTGQLIVLTTHDLTLSAQADRLILLNRDGVVANGNARDILQDQDAWQRAGLTLPDWFIEKQRLEGKQ